MKLVGATVERFSCVSSPTPPATAQDAKSVPPAPSAPLAARMQGATHLVELGCARLHDLLDRAQV